MKIKPGTYLQVIVFILITAYTTAYARTTSLSIGIPIPLTGDLKEFGLTMKDAFELAKDTINHSGGIDGKVVHLLYADDKGSVSGVSSAFKQLESKSVMLVGGYASDPTYLMAEMAEKADIPFLICSASADKITQRRWKNVFRLNPPISEYTKGLEDFFVKHLKPNSMAIVYENSSFGTNGALRMIEFCQKQAIEIKFSFPYDKTRTDPVYYRTLLAQLKTDIPDVIYMVSYLEDAVRLVKHIKELQLDSYLCGGAGGFTLSEFIKKTPEISEKLLVAAPWSQHAPYPKSKIFAREYLERYGVNPDYHAAEAYSALLVAAYALQHAESFNSRDIRESLNKTFLKTPFGPVKFYSYELFERQNSINTLVLQIIDGKFETVWPLDLASKPYVR